MSVRSNVERGVSEEMSTEVEQKLYFSLLFCTKEKRGSVSKGCLKQKLIGRLTFAYLHS